MKPGEHFDRDVDFETLLQGRGWEPSGPVFVYTGKDGVPGPAQHFTRPGKESGTSGTLHLEKKLFYVFTSNGGGKLEAGKAYGPFAFLACSDFDGNFSEAAKDLARQGFGNDEGEDEDTIGEGDERFPATEDGAASAFVHRHADDLRFDATLGAWFKWTGTHWQRDQTRLAFDFARQVCRKFSKVRGMSTARAARAVECFAQADQRIAVTHERWDVDPFLLGTPGGTVDLRTGELRPARPSEHITKLTSCPPADSEDCPTFLRFMDEITLGDVELQRFLKQFLGYCCSGSVREEMLVFAYGTGANGKSKLQEAIGKVLGDYSRVAPVDVLMAAKGDRHPTELAMLAGARFVTASETESGRTWAEARIKALTGGDPVTARFMRQDFFTFQPQMKLFVVGNKKPALSVVDEAMRRRFAIVPFRYKPLQKDTELSAKLAKEHPGILRWLLNGCADWLENGLSLPAVVKTASDEYFEAQDMVGNFLRDNCAFGEKLWCKRRDLFEQWLAYAKIHGLPQMSEAAFADDIGTRGARSANKNTREGTFRAFIGLELRNANGWSVGTAEGF